MLKKIALVFVLALSVVSAVGATSYPQGPPPPCLPCSGGGN